MSLILRTTLAVHDGKAEAFRAVATQWVEATRTEPGTLGFHLFYDQAGGDAVFLEHYADAEAFGAHAAAVAPDLRASLYTTCAFQGLDVYGDVSEDVRERLTAAGAHFFDHIVSK